MHIYIIKRISLWCDFWDIVMNPIRYLSHVLSAFTFVMGNFACYRFWSCVLSFNAYSSSVVYLSGLILLRMLCCTDWIRKIFTLEPVLERRHNLNWCNYLNSLLIKRTEMAALGRKLFKQGIEQLKSKEFREYLMR